MNRRATGRMGAPRPDVLVPSLTDLHCPAILIRCLLVSRRNSRKIACFNLWRVIVSRLHNPCHPRVTLEWAIYPTQSGTVLQKLFFMLAGLPSDQRCPIRFHSPYHLLHLLASGLNIGPLAANPFEADVQLEDWPEHFHTIRKMSIHFSFALAAKIPCRAASRITAENAKHPLRILEVQHRRRASNVVPVSISCEVFSVHFQCNLV